MIHGGESEQHINIDFSVNLNPLGTPKKVWESARLGLDKSVKYPEYSALGLSSKLAELEGVALDRVLPGNGASELIMAVVRAVNPRNALLIEPCFYGYRHALESLENCRITEYILDERNEFALTDDIASAIEEHTDIVFLTNPWNPLGLGLKMTPWGRGLGFKNLSTLLERAGEVGCAVVLDESFLLLSDACLRDTAPGDVGSRLPATRRNELIDTYPNLYIIRSFTKLMAIPGIRIGYMMSCSVNVAKVKKQLCEWNISQVADYVGRTCAEIIQTSEFVADSNALIVREREYLTNALTKRGIKVFTSNTVFILIKSELNLYEKLLQRNILIRDCSEFKGLGSGYYRIAVKDHESNTKLIEAIDEIRTC